MNAETWEYCKKKLYSFSQGSLEMNAETWEYCKKKLYALAILLLIIGGLNWGYFAFTGFNLVTMLVGRGAVANMIFAAVGVAALSLAFSRDVFLPFLGQTLMPCSVLKPQIPEGADFEMNVFIRPGAKVLYWAAEPETEHLGMVKSWREAYLGVKNAGVAIADMKGNVTLKVRKPQPYTVPIRGQLEPHIHYRVCGDSGMLSAVTTIKLDQKEYFENVVSERETPALQEMFQGPQDAFQATLEPFQGPLEQPMPMVRPETAERELNTVALLTQTNSHMIESGALGDGSLTAGADIDAAFQSPTPVKYTTIRYQ